VITERHAFSSFIPRGDAVYEARNCNDREHSTETEASSCISFLTGKIPIQSETYAEDHKCKTKKKHLSWRHALPLTFHLGGR
jgi:hypothetical protein